jgi:hypothetical protein
MDSIACVFFPELCSLHRRMATLCALRVFDMKCRVRFRVPFPFDDWHERKQERTEVRVSHRENQSTTRGVFLCIMCFEGEQLF